MHVDKNAHDSIYQSIHLVLVPSGPGDRYSAKVKAFWGTTSRIADPFYQSGKWIYKSNLLFGITIIRYVSVNLLLKQQIVCGK